MANPGRRDTCVYTSFVGIGCNSPGVSVVDRSAPTRGVQPTSTRATESGSLNRVFLARGINHDHRDLTGAFARADDGTAASSGAVDVAMGED